MKYAVGIDLGGTFIKYAIINEGGEFIFDGKIPSKATISADSVIGQLTTAIETCQGWAASHGIRLQGTGIGTPGIVDASQRTVLGGAENIAGWENILLADNIQNTTGLFTLVNNDANLMGLGETRYGAARGCSDVVFLTIGTGIGGAVIINGRLFGGYANRGSELGHTPLFAEGETCACGSTGCLEHYASASALVRRFTHRCRQAGITFPHIDGELIVSLYHQQHPLAIEALQEHFSFLGRGIAGFINIFSPQRVVIGGGISEAGDFYTGMISREAFRHAIPACSCNTRIVKAALGNKAGSLGAASLILNGIPDTKYAFDILR